MSSMVKHVFVIVGTLVLSLILFQLFLGDIGRERIWHMIEPVFKSTWNANTFNDGKLIEQQYTTNFNSLQEVHD
jgi:hypothetical protein